MVDTREDIARHGNGDHWIYEVWRGVTGAFIDEWFMAEGTGPGNCGVSGSHRDTVEEVLADIEQFKAEREADGMAPRDSWRVIRCTPVLKISIEREV